MKWLLGITSFWRTSFGGGGGNTTATTNTKAEPPSWAVPFGFDLLNRASGESSKPYQSYEGQQVAQLSPQTQYGLQAQFNRGSQGSPLMKTAGRTLQNTAAGNYLDVSKEPGYQSTIRNAIGQANKQFSGAPGAFGGSANQEITTRAAADAAGNLYNSAAQRQLAAAQMAPQFANQDYTDIQQMLQAGDVYGQREQDILNTQYQNWLAQMQYPYNQLDVLSNAIAGATGGRSTTTSTGPAPYQYNRAAGGVGGGLLGYGAGSMAAGAYPGSELATSSPYWGTALGAALGAFG